MSKNFLMDCVCVPDHDMLQLEQYMKLKFLVVQCAHETGSIVASDMCLCSAFYVNVTHHSKTANVTEVLTEDGFGS